ncbi:MAG: glycogen/starch synthase [Myxococcota bacterium]
MNILTVTSEMVPYAKTGGLADVLGALPRSLADAGHDVRVFVPFYQSIPPDSGRFVTAIESMDVVLGDHTYEVRILRDDNNPIAYFVHCPQLYARKGLYTHDGDEHRRFLALCWAALKASQIMRFAPDVVHCNDWQSSMLPLILRTRFGWDRLFANAYTLLTIHNLNYQGGFSAAILPDLNLRGSEHLLHQDFLRGGRINFLLHGVMYADGVSTVSPTYAQEIQTSAHGAGLDGFLRARSTTVVGILNGVDYDAWSPECDDLIPFAYSIDDLSGKERNKQVLLEKLGLPYVEGVPVAGVVSRLASQKGLDLIPDALVPLLNTRGLQLVVLGSGSRRLEEMFAQLQWHYPKQVVFYRGYSNPLAHLIEAGADMFLMPSRYEPCGLNQLYSMRYGTVPVVHRTGGLADTVRPWNPRTQEGTGFVFEHHDAMGLRWAVASAMETFEDQGAWRRLMAQGMRQDYSWNRQTRIYETLFSRLISQR